MRIKTWEVLSLEYPLRSREPRNDAIEQMSLAVQVIADVQKLKFAAEFASGRAYKL